MKEFAPLIELLHRSVRRAPDVEAVVRGEERLSYADLWARVSAVEGWLRARGIQPGDRVAVMLENSAEYIAAYYGVLAAAGVAVGLNTATRSQELTRLLAHCGARYLFADGRHPDMPQIVEHKPAGCQVVAWHSDTLPEGMRRTDVASTPPVTVASLDPGTPAAIIYTSGTTGRPKGVTLSHGNLWANLSGIVEYFELTAADRVLNLLPFSYSYGSSVLHSHLAVGGTLVLENHLVYPQKILARMAEERVTGFPGVPSTFALLLQCRNLDQFDLGSLRYLTQAGGPMAPETIRRVVTALPHAKLYVMYGQTEATARLTYVPPARLGEKLGSVGVPLPGVEIEVRGEDGRTRASGDLGEVCVRGPNVMLGYYDDPTATSKVLREGWLHTGDLGHVDADGYLYLQGRRSDMIKSGAHRISPTDIEDVIGTLPEVAEVAVVGIPDNLLGETIKAVVVVRSGMSLDGMTVQRHCSIHLPRFKIPKVVEFAIRLPRTASGKIMRSQLAHAEVGHDDKARMA